MKRLLVVTVLAAASVAAFLRGDGLPLFVLGVVAGYAAVLFVVLWAVGKVADYNERRWP